MRYVDGVDLQQVVSLIIVGITAAILVRQAAGRRKAGWNCVSECRCGARGPSPLQGSKICRAQEAEFQQKTVRPK
jgi:hypothetical protein